MPNSKTVEAPSSELQAVFSDVRRRHTGYFGLLYIAALVMIAILAPFIAPFDPLAQNLEHRLQPPTYPHLLGLDEFGRDVLSRIIYGTTISIQIGLEVVSLSLLIGVAIGTLSGYYGGRIDMLLMRVADVFLAFPSLVLAIGIMAALGPGIFKVILALVVVAWPRYARVIRSQTLYLKNLDFIAAAKAMGASTRRILLSHIIPNALPPVIILGTLGMGEAILAEAGLSFLGLGVSPPTPSWGVMVSSARDYILQAPHIVGAAGTAISLTVLAFNLLGDGLRDALDPKLRI